MNTLTSILFAALLCPAAAAQTAPAGETIGSLARSAAKQLEQSTAELNRLREEITQEKLPLAQDLTALEEHVIARRRDHEQVARAVDAASLEIAGIKSSIQAHQAELDYVGTLLNDFAHDFESRMSIGEQQRYGPFIETAKQAPENKSLSVAQKFERQTALAGVAIQRLFDCLSGLRFPGTGVDLEGAVVQGTFTIVGPVAIFGAKSGLAGLVVPQTGSPNPLIRPLEGRVQSGLATLVATGEGLLPLDPSRGGALKALVQKTNLIYIFEKGGPIMWPLLVASILALGTVLERVFFLVNERRKRDPRAMEQLFASVERGDTAAAIQTSKQSRFFVVRALGYALEHKEHSLANALIYAQAQELKRFRRGIPILDTVITLAPLLGLLGTVTGMMGSFKLIGGELSAPGAITGGISEALIATAFGLGIAITALIPFNILNSKLEEAGHEIDSAAKQLELVVRGQETREVVLLPEPRAHARHPAAGEAVATEV
jgi:biopolymer transport protein ExbB